MDATSGWIYDNNHTDIGYGLCCEKAEACKEKPIGEYYTSCYESGEALADNHPLFMYNFPHFSGDDPALTDYLRPLAGYLRALAGYLRALTGYLRVFAGYPHEQAGQPSACLS